jgi:peroxin-11B
MSAVQLQQILKFLAMTSGKDKVAKIVQYGARLLAAFLRDQTPKPALLGRIEKLGAAVTSGRKVFFFGNEIQELNTARSQYKVIANGGDLSTLLSFARSLCMSLYWVLDHVAWLDKIGFLEYKSTRLQKLSATFWFFGVVFTLILDTRKYQSLTQTHRTPDSREIRAQQQVLLWKNFRGFCDLVTSAAAAELYSFADKKVALAGVISALIASWEIWPA